MTTQEAREIIIKERDSLRANPDISWKSEKMINEKRYSKKNV